MDERHPARRTREEVAGFLAKMDGLPALLARLLYGTGMRLMEGMRLRIRDVDFSDINTTVIHTRVLKVAACDTASPLHAPTIG